MKVLLSFELSLRDDLGAAEWTMMLGQALEHLRPALTKGTVPVVSTGRVPAEGRAAAHRVIDEALTGEPVLTTDEQAAAARHARDVVGRDAESPLCRCGHRRLMHDPVGATHLRGECNERGCRCGLFQSVEKVANANASAGGTR